MPSIGEQPPEDEPQGLSHGWALAQVLVAALLAVLLAVGALGFVLNAVMPSGGAHGTSRGGQVALAVVCLVLLALCLRWVVWVEHRLGQGHAVARSFAERAPRTIGRRRRYGPCGTAFSMIAFAAFTVAGIAGTVANYQQAARSSFTQGHGVSTMGTVLMVANTQHCSRHGCTYTAAITVSLSPPVAGRTLSTVHFAGFSNLVSGDRASVLVDPRQLDYAEFPGAPFKTTLSWVMMLLLAVVMAGMTVADALGLRRMLAHQREHRAAYGAPALVPAS